MAGCWAYVRSSSGSVSLYASQQTLRPPLCWPGHCFVPARTRTTPTSGETEMPRYQQKTDFPVSQVRRYLEPGPIVLVSSKWRGKANIMTMGWHTVMEFTPSLIG